MDHLRILVSNPGFHLISNQIFQHLSFEDLQNCRLISKDFQNFVDNERKLWTNQIKSLDDLSGMDGNSFWKRVCDLFLEPNCEISEIQSFVNIAKTFLKSVESGTAHCMIDHYKNKFPIILFLMKYYKKVDYNLAFVIACISCNLEDVIINTFDSKKVSKSSATLALNLASAKGRSDIVKYLLNFEHFDVNGKFTNGKPGFYFACLYGNAEVVKILLNYPRANLDDIEILVAITLTESTLPKQEEVLQILKAKAKNIDIENVNLHEFNQLLEYVVMNLNQVIEY